MSDEPKKARKRREKQPSQPERLSEETIAFMGEIFLGFDVWYRASYDESGRLLPTVRIPGLTPQKDEDEA